MIEMNHLKQFTFMTLLFSVLFVPVGILASTPNIATGAAQAAFDCNFVTQIPFNECEALEGIYNDMNGDNWNIPSGLWLRNNVPCGIAGVEPNWFGIKCSNGHVTALYMGDFNVQSPLSPEIGNLIYLKRLELESSGVTHLPVEIGDLTDLTYLDLEGNELTSLPSEIGKLSNLTHLILRANDLASLPTEIGGLGNLSYFVLNNNNLSSLPAEIGNLDQLRTFILDENKMASLPPEIGNLDNLEYFYLNNNNLSSLPSEIGNLNQLHTLHLYENKIASLPPEIGNLDNLEYLYLENNNLSSLPAEIGNLSDLARLYLHNNELNNLPAEIGKIGNLSSSVWIILSNNPLRGPFPKSLVNNENLRLFYYQETDLCPLSGRSDEGWSFPEGNGLPPCTQQVMTDTAVSLSSFYGLVTYHFAADTFTDTVKLTYQPLYYSVPKLAASAEFMRFTVTAVYSATNQPAIPTKPYTITINYASLPVVSDTVQLNYSDGTRWVPATAYTVDTEQQTISMLVNELSHEFKDWAISGLLHHIYLQPIQHAR